MANIEKMAEPVPEIAISRGGASTAPRPDAAPKGAKGPINIDLPPSSRPGHLLTELLEQGKNKKPTQSPETLEDLVKNLDRVPRAVSNQPQMHAGATTTIAPDQELEVEVMSDGSEWVIMPDGTRNQITPPTPLRGGGRGGGGVGGGGGEPTPESFRPENTLTVDIRVCKV